MRTLVLLTAAALAAACTGDPLTVPSSDELFIHVAIAPVAASPANTELRAFVLIAGTPLASPYLTADRFEMRRAADGALFDWRAQMMTEPAVHAAGSTISSDAGNYRLPLVGSGALLGRQDIRAGESYSLLVESGGRVITGMTTVPGIPSLVRVPSVASDPFIWHSVGGAGGYSISAPPFFPFFGTTPDTSFTFESGSSCCTSAAGIVVRAYDSQLYSYVVDGRLGRSGLSAGLGVFGSFNTDSIVDPRKRK